MCLSEADGILNSVGPDQTDLGIHCLLRPVGPKIEEYNGALWPNLKVIRRVP